MPVRNVTIEDCGRVEGEDITPLYTALKEVCPGLEGEAIWEKVREKYNLGVAGDCNSWVTHMNHAISIWNRSKPKDCVSVRTAYDV